MQDGSGEAAATALETAFEAALAAQVRLVGVMPSVIIVIHDMYF